jgi:hypothetical protein
VERAVFHRGSHGAAEAASVTTANGEHRGRPPGTRAFAGEKAKP